MEKKDNDDTQGILFWDVYDLGLIRFWLKPPKDGKTYRKQPTCGFYANPQEDAWVFIEEAKEKYRKEIGKYNEL